jgi:hypothetical protein
MPDRYDQNGMHSAFTIWFIDITGEPWEMIYPQVVDRKIRHFFARVKVKDSWGQNHHKIKKKE